MDSGLPKQWSRVRSVHIVSGRVPWSQSGNQITIHLLWSTSPEHLGLLRFLVCSTSLKPQRALTELPELTVCTIQHNFHKWRHKILCWPAHERLIIAVEDNLVGHETRKILSLVLSARHPDQCPSLQSNCSRVALFSFSWLVTHRRVDFNSGVYNAYTIARGT